MAKMNVSLPGYNAETDTNLDHFALYSTGDNILIKEKSRGEVTVTSSSTYTLAHGLDYIPLVYCFTEVSSGVWRRVDGASFDGNYGFEIDTTNLYLNQYTGTDKKFRYYIFYDDVTTGSPTFTESSTVVKVTKSGYNAFTEKNPNNFIFHSDLNTFKVIKTGLKTITVSGYTNDQSFTEAHGLSFTPFIRSFSMEDGTGRAIPPNSPDITFAPLKDTWWTTGLRFNYEQSDATNLTFNFDNASGSKTVKVRYFCLEKI